MNYNLIAYTVYAPIVIALTIWVAKMLHKNTSAFLIEIFSVNEKVALATNNLLQTGFYLISLGFAFVRIKIRGKSNWNGNTWEYIDITSYRETIEELAVKLGGFTLFIGFILFLNLFLMLILRKSSKNKHIPQQMHTFIQPQK